MISPVVVHYVGDDAVIYPAVAFEHYRAARIGRAPFGNEVAHRVYGYLFAVTFGSNNSFAPLSSTSCRLAGLLVRKPLPPASNRTNNPGARVFCQVWYRDTTALGSAVSEALVFTVEP